MEIGVNDFRTITRQSVSRPRPLYLSTAAQIGLVANPNIPDLVSQLLPASRSAHSARFLRRWLLSPPTHSLADSFSSLCFSLRSGSLALPVTRPVPVGKIVSMILARQCNSGLFRDIEGILRAVVDMLSRDHEGCMSSITLALAELTSSESGFIVDRGTLHAAGIAIVKRIHNVIPDPVEMEDCVSQDAHDMIPETFFENNELEFRGCVRPLHSEEALEAYGLVQTTAEALSKAVKEDFQDSSRIHYDSFNNILTLREGSSKAPSDVEFKTAVDRYNKSIRDRLTTSKVSSALSEYKAACVSCTKAVKKALQKLSESLDPHIGHIIQAAHWCVILDTAVDHTRSSIQKGWILPTLVNRTEGNGGFVMDLQVT